jgi:hypothetical protein
MSRWALLLVVVAVVAVAPRLRWAESESKSNERVIVWQRVGSWSGTGSRQTESFASGTGVLRVHWEATGGELYSPARRFPAFRLTARSAISGRLLQQVVDHAGPGSGVSYVQQNPHTFYIIIEASDMNWTITIDDAIGYR